MAISAVSGRFLMLFPFLLHFLLLPSLLILCKKRKTERKSTPVGASPKKKVEEPAAEPGTASSLATESPLEVCKTQEDGTRSREERKRQREDIAKQQAKIIWNIKNEFNPKNYKAQTFSKERLDRMKSAVREHCEDIQYASQYFVKRDFQNRVADDYRKTHTIYKNHRCPKKQGSRHDEECDICRAYMDWAGYHYELGLKEDKYPEGFQEKLEEDFYDYEGKLPPGVEGPRWAEARERIRKRRAGGGGPVEEEKALEATQKTEVTEERPRRQQNEAETAKSHETLEIEATQCSQTQEE